MRSTGLLVACDEGLGYGGYSRAKVNGDLLVETRGIEPLTPALQRVGIASAIVYISRTSRSCGRLLSGG
jgi:hypothetical protein